jgi:hypothetical protein
MDRADRSFFPLAIGLLATANLAGVALALNDPPRAVGPFEVNPASTQDPYRDGPVAAAERKTTRTTVGFEGMDYRDGFSRQVPASPAIAAGDDKLITAVNPAVRIFNTDGLSLYGPVAPETFFSGGPSQCLGGLFSPDAVYDEEHDRFILGYSQGGAVPDGGYCLAVSASSDPTGSWYIYFLPLNDGSTWIPSGRLAVGDDYVVLGSNLFGLSGGFAGARLWAMSKEQLYGGSTPDLLPRDLNLGLSSPQPLHLSGWRQGTWPEHGDDVYVLSELYDGRNFRVHRWSVDADTFTEVGAVDFGGGGGQPPLAPQLGGDPLAPGDFRIRHFDYRNGYAWTSQGIGCNPGDGTVGCIRWAQIDLATMDIGFAGVGVLGDDSAHRIFPALTANRCGDMVVAYTRTSPSSYPGLYAAARNASAPAGELLAESALVAGEITYTAFDGSPYRWGDYTAIAASPDGERIWIHGTYSKDTGTTNGRWGTWVDLLINPGCSAAWLFTNGFENDDTTAWQ